MLSRRYRRCHCMNNCPNYAQDVIEDKCQDMCNCIEHDNNDCDCGFEEEYDVFPTNPMLAQSYVPFQYMDKTFKPCIGLKMGTIFPELVSPYEPCQSMEQISYIERTNKIGEGCNQCQQMR